MKTRLSIMKPAETSIFKNFYVRFNTLHFQVKNTRINSSIMIGELEKFAGWNKYKLFNLNLYKIYLILKEE